MRDDDLEFFELGERLIGRESSGTDVLAVQGWLNHSELHGYFDKETDKLVRDYQHIWGLKADGFVGPKETWPHMIEKFQTVTPPEPVPVPVDPDDPTIPSDPPPKPYRPAPAPIEERFGFLRGLVVAAMAAMVVAVLVKSCAG